MWYVWIYSSFALSYGAFSGIRSFVLCRSNIIAMRNLHSKMMGSLLNAPINKIFERIPVGRILNRFTEDINTCDLSLPFAIGSVLVNIYSIIGTTGLLIYLSNYIMAPLILILLMLMNCIGRSFLKSNR